MLGPTSTPDEGLAVTANDETTSSPRVATPFGATAPPVPAVVDGPEAVRVAPQLGTAVATPFGSTAPAAALPLAPGAGAGAAEQEPGTAAATLQSVAADSPKEPHDVAEASSSAAGATRRRRRSTVLLAVAAGALLVLSVVMATLYARAQDRLDELASTVSDRDSSISSLKDEVRSAKSNAADWRSKWETADDSLDEEKALRIAAENARDSAVSARDSAVYAATTCASAVEDYYFGLTHPTINTYKTRSQAQAICDPIDFDIHWP
jgi:hypothetical protein